MSDACLAGSAGVVRVVWWRDAAGDRDLPRAHGVGWATTDGSLVCTVQIASPHLRLQPVDIEGELRARLAEYHIDRYELRPVSDRYTEISSLVRLAVAGHRVTRVDLATAFGLDAVGGVVAELTGRGVRGTVLVEATLSSVLADAVAEWADTALTQFSLAAESELLDQGWQKTVPGRWQLVARQSGTPTR